MYARPVNSPKAGVQSFVFTQTTASTIWTINHGLNRAVSVTLLDGGNEEIVGTVVHTNLNTVTVTFNVPVSGQALIT